MKMNYCACPICDNVDMEVCPNEAVTEYNNVWLCAECLESKFVISKLNTEKEKINVQS